jgi:hypothetical protein
VGVNEFAELLVLAVAVLLRQCVTGVEFWGASSLYNFWGPLLEKECESMNAKLSMKLIEK